VGALVNALDHRCGLAHRVKLLAVLGMTENVLDFGRRRLDLSTRHVAVVDIGLGRLVENLDALRLAHELPHAICFVVGHGDLK